jgi:alkylated DNA repair dioxygenase AlkB
MSQFVTHVSNFLNEEQSKELFTYLEKNAEWDIWPLSPNSRQVARFFNGNIPWILSRVIDKIEHEFNLKILRQAFLNIYRNGEDYCPYHADMYGVNTYTISLGSTRDFLLKSNNSGTKAVKYTLKSGDLYIMDKQVHTEFKHSIPKRKSVTTPRISILLFQE